MSRTIEDQLLNPRPGSAAARARDFGIDLTLLIGRLKLTPEERLRELQRTMSQLETLRASLRGQDNSSHGPTRTDAATVDRPAS